MKPTSSEKLFQEYVTGKPCLMRMVSGCPDCGYLLWCLLMVQASLQLDIGKIVVPKTCI